MRSFDAYTHNSYVNLAQFGKKYLVFVLYICGSLLTNVSKFVRIEMTKSTKGTNKFKAKSKPLFGL